MQVDFLSHSSLTTITFIIIIIVVILFNDFFYPEWEPAGGAR